MTRSEKQNAVLYVLAHKVHNENVFEISHNLSCMNDKQIDCLYEAVKREEKERWEQWGNDNL